MELAGSKEDHERVFTTTCSPFLESVSSLFPHLTILKQQAGRFLDANSCIVRAAVLLLAAAQDDSVLIAPFHHLEVVEVGKTSKRLIKGKLEYMFVLYVLCIILYIRRKGIRARSQSPSCRVVRNFENQT